MLKINHPIKVRHIRALVKAARKSGVLSAAEKQNKVAMTNLGLYESDQEWEREGENRQVGNREWAVREGGREGGNLGLYESDQEWEREGENRQVGNREWAGREGGREPGTTSPTRSGRGKGRTGR